MGIKGDNCTCVTYCDCVYPPGEPCGCSGMAKDPHCMYCCQHLTPEQEIKWRQEVEEQETKWRQEEPPSLPKEY